MKHIMLSLCLMLLAPLANAALIVDQNQDLNSSNMAAFSQTDLAQSFQQTNGNIAGAGIFLFDFGGNLSDTVTIALWDALPTNGGNLITAARGIANEGSWFDVFWNPVAITPDTTYFLVFTSLNNTLNIAGATNNPYSRGQVYANSGFQSFPTFDYTFRTYAEANVPETETLLMLGLALAGLGMVRRKKNK